jgi:hypothetical protein
LPSLPIATFHRFHIAIVGHRSFSSVSHFAPNYIIPNYITALPSLPIATFHRFRISHRTMVIAPFHRRITVVGHRSFSSVSHLAPNYIIALQNFIGFTFCTELHYRIAKCQFR